MSEPQLISPLLDGFVMGDPISNHDGVRACPAMQLETDTRYIVKIISLPASQSKLYALLLAGAFSDREAARVYFKELSDDVLAEAELLQKLSRHEGFVSFDNWQLATMDGNDIGYDVYLLGKYRPTLEGVLRQNEMTHLQAINLGLDLCAALSASRRFGYLYSNLRPSNVYICNEREFRIGDLGFISLDSLQYASLPDKYHSDYTPPEISDAYSALNTTLDTYAVGLILYQAYNDGRLPAIGGTPIAPARADADLAEIILKACALDPADRWQDPVQFGQALATYMQSHTVNDTPIAPPPPVEEISEPEPVFPDEDTEPKTEDVLAEVDEALDNAPPLIVPEAASDEIESAAEEAVDEEPNVEEDSGAEIAEDEVTEDEVATDEVTEDEVATDEAAEAEIAADEVPVDDVPAEEEADDNGPDEATLEILAQVDALIAHKLPEPPVAPEPIEVTLPEPEPVVTETDDSVTEETEIAQPVEPTETHDEGEEEEDEEAAYIAKPTPKKKKHKKGLATLAGILLALLLIVFAGIFFYQNYYLQTIHDIVLTGSDDALTVTLMTDTADELLSVVCTDTHGNSLTAEVRNGTAHFVGLKPGITYFIEVRVSGFRTLIGRTTKTYSTGTQTTISGFYATPGPESGSVVLNFTVQGPGADKWLIQYNAQDEAMQTVPCVGHTATLTGLTPGKEYIFLLLSEEIKNLEGNTTIVYTLPDNAPVIEKVQFDASNLNELKVTWNLNGSVPAGDWVISYSVDNIPQDNVTCTGTTGTITPLIPGASYKIQIRPANGSAVSGGNVEFQSEDAPAFDTALITSRGTTFKMSALLQAPINYKAEFEALQERTSFTAGQQASITLRLKDRPIDREGSVVILSVIRDANGQMISNTAESISWDQMWHGQYHFFTLNMPQVAGNYNATIYFDGAEIITQDFTVTA